MEIDILVVGQDESASSFYDLCADAGIAATLMDPDKHEHVDLRVGGMVVQFVGDNLEIPGPAEISGLKGASVWLAESVSHSVTAMAGLVEKPERFVGFSLSGLFPEKKMVEVVAGERTASDALAIAKKMFETLQFAVVESCDRPGHVLNRVVASMINEAIYVYMYGLGRMEDIDQMMKLAANFPMGPFEYADAIGLDRVLKTLEWLTNEMGPQYRPCPLLRRKVEAGYLGRKTARGFYTY